MKPTSELITERADDLARTIAAQHVYTKLDCGCKLDFNATRADIELAMLRLIADLGDSNE